ncbi:reverse transcriptase domain-containing protein [Tanacetum coccineum]
MDIVGPLLEALGKINYLIVAVDYFTKWIKAKAVTSITGKHVKNFAFDNIVCRFEIPATIITDNETQLMNDPFKSWAEGLGIKLVSTSVYHPQANGAVERANRSIMQGIKTRLHREGGAWVEELPNVLWAHMTTPKTSNKETPFSLAYGTEAVIPVEIGIPTRRTIQRSDEENEEALRMNLNLLEERREIATIKEARRKQQVEKYYNQRVNHKQFKVGEFVL